MLNRRAFLQRLASGVAAMTAVAVAGARMFTRRPPTVGSINNATYSFWRNQQQTGDGTAQWDALAKAMRAVHQKCS